MYSIEPFCATIGRIERIFIPLFAVVLGIFISKRAADKGALLGGFKEIEGN
jgi:hypothetical protein